MSRTCADCGAQNGHGKEYKELLFTWSTKYYPHGIFRDNQLLVGSVGPPYACRDNFFNRSTEMYKCIELEELEIDSNPDSAWLTTRPGRKEWAVVALLREGIGYWQLLQCQCFCLIWRRRTEMGCGEWGKSPCSAGGGCWLSLGCWPSGGD